MAGYIFTLNNEDSLHEMIINGFYSTYLNINTDHWKAHHEGTFADYLSMSEGDHVYFFIKRKIFGIGKLRNVGLDCKYLNFPGADSPEAPKYKDVKSSMLLDGSSRNLDNRVLCTFSGNPAFFKHGIDMDEVLMSNPEAFKMLRVLWKRSFIKIDDKEDAALFDVILKTNEGALRIASETFTESPKLHNRISRLVGGSYEASAGNLLDLASMGERIKHEMAIEAGVIEYIKKSPSGIFGNWDYLSHQVVASPFKPIDYMDKMDIFGYRRISPYKTISKYLVIELKKGIADKEVIHQVMKYVDWVNQEYAYKDYSMVEAFVVASDFPTEVVSLKEEVGTRIFAQGSRPVKTEKWAKLRLIKYRFNPTSKQLEFTEVH